MPALIDLRRRIRSVRNTQQVTKAMKTVATAKYKKAHRRIVEGRPHWHTAPALIDRLARQAGEAAHPILAVRPERAVHVVVLTTDKGLCGSFNSNLLARALALVKEKAQTSRVSLVLVGKKAMNFFRRYPYSVERTYADHVDKLGEDALREIARSLARHFLFLETDAVYLAYNEFKSVLAPKVTVARLLPLAADEIPVTGDAAAAGPVTRPDWEPGAPELLASLLPRFIEDQVLHAYFESQAAEQAARMMAMDSASKNAGDLIEALTLVLNKVRQAGITKELLEIMTAVEALKT
jgi:F-type H+-transporting ATPase subunit gamma